MSTPDIQAVVTAFVEARVREGMNVQDALTLAVGLVQVFQRIDPGTLEVLMAGARAAREDNR